MDATAGVKRITRGSAIVVTSQCAWCCVYVSVATPHTIPDVYRVSSKEVHCKK